MKYSNCDARQKKAWKNIMNCASDYIFGLQNACFDNDKDSIEYKDYFTELNNLDSLIKTVYNESLTTLYTGNGGCKFGPSIEKDLKDLRFCGKPFLMKVTKFYCKKYQAEALEEVM